MQEANDGIELTHFRQNIDTVKEEDDKRKTSVQEESVGLKKTITLFNGITIIVGCMIGSGIFITPTGVLLNSKSYGSAVIIWILCGIHTMIGSYCYAELGCLIKRSSGDYAYIFKAFGPMMGFLRMWVDVVVTRPCSTTIMALTFAQYVLEPFYVGCTIPMLNKQILAACCIILITFINCFSVKLATKVQDIFTAAKLFALVILIGTGLYKLSTGSTENWEGPFDDTSYKLQDWAMGFYSGLFAFTGWTFLNCMIEEMKNPVRDLPRAIFISCILVTVVYVLTNVAYFTLLSKAEILASEAVAVGIGAKYYGPMWWVIPVFVAMSTFGGVNGNLMTTSRIFMVAAQVKQMPQCLSMISILYTTPIPSVLFGTLCSMVYLLYPDIYSLINYVGFATWMVYGVAVLALIQFRRTLPLLPRPIKVNLIFPYIYIIVTTLLVILSFVGAYWESMAGLAIVISGMPVYCVFVLWQNKLPRGFHLLIDGITSYLQKIFLVVVPENQDESI